MGDFDPRVWYTVFRCPSCGMKSHVTDVCRSCPSTPADSRASTLVYCEDHKVYHMLDDVPMTHRNVRMVATGWATRLNPLLGRAERRKIKNLPEGAIVR